MLNITIVGRPNVGKSTLFNRLIGQKQAIVDDQPGVTRDRLYGEMDWYGKNISIIDTGGYLEGETDRLGKAIVENAVAGIMEADVIIMLVDCRNGVTSSDKDLVDFLRKVKKPKILAVNKVDSPNYEADVFPFYELGFDDLFGVSCIHGNGLDEMMDRAVELGPDEEDIEKIEEGIIRVTILGRPNVGKSMLLNKLAGKERSLVDANPGTTRDPVDTLVEHKDHKYLFVDTAGIRSSGKIQSNIEFYGIVRAKKTLNRSDVALLMVDADEGPTERDARVFKMACDAGRSCIILINKWDLVEKETGTAEAFEENLRDKFPFLHFAPVIFISALSGQRVHRIFQHINTVYDAGNKRLISSELGKLLELVTGKNPPPCPQGKQIKFYYWTQTGVAPVRLTLFCNRPYLVPDHYERYLLNQLYDRFEFPGVPVQLQIKKSPKREKE